MTKDRTALLAIAEGIAEAETLASVRHPIDGEASSISVLDHHRLKLMKRCCTANARSHTTATVGQFFVPPKAAAR
jgi:hypothetical protein